MGRALGAAFVIISLSIGTLFALGVFMKPMEDAMGWNRSSIGAISCIGMGLGSWAGGFIHDALGTYQWLFLTSMTIGVMAVVMGVTLRPPSRVPSGMPVERLAV